jgi:hypothetical protein
MDPARQKVVDWIMRCVLGDLRTLDKGISVVEAAGNEQGLPAGMGGGNFLLAVGCLIAIEYFGGIFRPDVDATMAARAYARKFLKPVDDRYPKVWELLWRTFRNGMVHASWPKKALIENDPSRQLILAVGNLRSDPHLAPLPGTPHSLAISAPRLLDDLDSSVKNGFSHWILTEADDGVLMRAGPQLLRIGQGDSVVCQQFRDAFDGQLTLGQLHSPRE